MRLRLITAPAAEPVTVAQATTQVNGYGTTHDTILGTMITAARGHLDGRKGILGRALVTQTWELLLDAFPAGNIEIPLPPLQSITSITYVDENGAPQTLATSVYAVDTVSEPGIVSLKYDQTWPTTRTERNAVTIRFVAGYGDVTAVPQALKSAMLLHVADLFENRERQGDQVFENRAYDDLIFPFRIVRP